jgi:hypothetical protein
MSLGREPVVSSGDRPSENKPGVIIPCARLRPRKRRERPRRLAMPQGAKQTNEETNPLRYGLGRLSHSHKPRFLPALPCPASRSTALMQRKRDIETATGVRGATWPMLRMRSARLIGPMRAALPFVQPFSACPRMTLQLANIDSTLVQGTGILMTGRSACEVATMIRLDHQSSGQYRQCPSHRTSRSTSRQLRPSEAS